MSEFTTRIIKRPMSDGSACYDVHLYDAAEETMIKLPAMTDADAEQLEEKLYRAIDDHTGCIVGRLDTEIKPD